MKKLIIAAMLVATAVSAQASKVLWGVSSAADTTKITTGTMYMCYAADGVDWSAFENQTSFSTDTLDSAGFTIYSENFAYSQSTLTTQNLNFTPSASGYPSGQKSYYFVLIGDAKQDGTQFVAYNTTAVSITCAATTGMLQQKKTTMNTYVQNTPEPTSGLLLLLGMAGLALKRKRA